jgi:hypothetical protein
VPSASVPQFSAAFAVVTVTSGGLPVTSGQSSYTKPKRRVYRVASRWCFGVARRARC